MGTSSQLPTQTSTGISGGTAGRLRPRSAFSGIRNWADRSWRLFGTGLSFFTFGVGGLILGAIVFPLCCALIRKPEKRQRFARRIVGGSFSAFVWMMKSLGVLSYETRGLDKLANVSGALIIANHPSLIDVVFLVSFFPQADCIIKRAVVRNPFMRGAVRAANYISNSEPEEILASCTHRLRAGSTLILFPEGTRRDQAEPLRFRLGAAAIAVRSQARIVRAFIRCEPATLRKNEAWYHIPVERPHWAFEFPLPASVEALSGGEQDPRRATRKLQESLLAYYEKSRTHLK